MTTLIWFLLLACLHLLICAVLFLGMKAGLLKVRRFLFFVALFLPFWGPLAVLLLSAQVALRRIDTKQIGVEKFQLESELYKGLVRDTSRASGSTISMEEALIVNTPKERRSLIMDVLNDNPKDYVDFLKKAGNNEDTEVVHYAVTAMVEMSKENDEMLWRLEKAYAEHPEDVNTLTEYCSFLWECLEQGLMQGQVEKMNRNLFDSLIQQKIRSTVPLLEDYLRCIENQLMLHKFSDADQMMEQARSRFPRNEELLLLRVRWAAATNQPGTIRILLDEIEGESLFLSGKAKEVIAFWKE